MEKSNMLTKAIRGIKFTLLAQVIILVLGILKSILLPKYLNVDAFGYWQVYLFYSSYVGIFAAGFNDGVYLRYGKYEYEDLPFQKLRSANMFYFLMLSGFTVVICSMTLLEKNPDRRFALLLSGLNILVMGINGLFIYVLQITNQIKKYSLYSIIDKIIMIISIVAIILINDNNYKNVIIWDLLAKMMVAIGLMVSCRKLVFGKQESLKAGLAEFLQDCKVGINLMIANLMGMLVTGIGRMVIEWLGDISEYAYYSFGMSVTNLIMVLITAVSLVLYPTLKRLPKDYYNLYFIRMNKIVSIFNFSALLIYFPAYLFIELFLPKYKPVLPYLNLLFGVIILQSKMSMLNNTFYKVLREERAMLRANMSSVAMFGVLSVALFSLTKSIWMIAMCTFLTMLFRCYASEIFLQKKMHMLHYKSIMFEMAYISLFLLVTTLLNFYVAFGIYVIQLLGYLFVFRKDIVHMLRKVGRES